ncbi:MAG: DUF4352 domain-containing protein [Candidatus Pacearchaeota archaeon]|nr:DUF4352 domain-containing protein [Candidatus Pacearchaeota archaeon]
MATKTKQKIVEDYGWFRRHRILPWVIIIVFFVITGLISQDDTTTSQQKDSVSEEINSNQKQIQQKCLPNWECGSWSQCINGGKQTRACKDINNCDKLNGKPKETQTCIYEYKIGDKVIVNNVAYTLHDVKTKSEIGKYLFDEFYGETADGIFYIFELTLENVGKESKTFWGTNVKIYDSLGRSFDHDSTAEIYLDDSFQYDQLQPGLPKRGKIVFDVPIGLTGRLEVSSLELFSNEKEYISWS